jgi:hypothetical protein
MKTLSNNKGIALVVLIVAMTLIAILGTSFVSLMGSKQKGFLYQIDSYRALNLANAGAEYMIKYANDETSIYNSTFFSSTQPFVLPTKQLSFSGGRTGTFDASYAFNQSIGSDVLTVTGTFGNATRQVKLSRFRYYAFENITRVPGSVRSVWSDADGYYVTIPLINNPDRNASTSVTISQIRLSIMGGANSLKRIYFRDYNKTDYKDKLIYDYSITAGSGCPALGSGSPLSIPPVQDVDISQCPIYIVVDQVVWLTFQFQGSALTGTYTVTCNFTNGQSSTVTFAI